MVSFKSNDGSDNTLYAEIVMPLTATVSGFPPDPVRPGYNFTGWNTQPDGTGNPFTASTVVTAYITVYAQWTLIASGPAVTFKLNDGTGNNHAVKIVASPGDTIPAPDFPGNPSRAGYTFGGWDTQPGGGGTAFTSSTAVNADIAVYAQWTPDTPGSYTVTFKLNDGTGNNHTVETVTPPADTVSSLPSIPTRSGYTFTGWDTQPGGGGTAFTSSTTVSASIAVYAQWDPEVYTVTFMSNYPTDTILHTKTVTVPATAIGSADFPANPARTGFTFTGWDTQPGGGGTGFTLSSLVNADRTVYAQWDPEVYTVTFKRNYDSSDAAILHTKTVTFPATAIGSADFPANPARSGYNFTGWDTQAGGGGTAFTSSSTVSADVTAYAQWTVIPPGPSVTFMMNDGTADTYIVKTAASAGAVISGFPANPTRLNYNFMGWNTQANGTGSPFTSTTMVSADIPVYAQWTTDTVITLDFDAGDGAFSQAAFTLFKGGSPNSQTVTITGSGYTSPRWEVDGILKGTGTSIAINAADYGTGGHVLTLFVIKSGVTWSKELIFTVEN
jgi:uncharacterized repeat protein (TIGR02543 family)